MTRSPWMIVVSALLSACAPSPRPAGALRAAGVDRLYCVAATDDGCRFYRSAQPEDDGALPVDVVVKLNSSIEHRERLGASQELFQHPWLPAGPVLHPETETALEDLDRALAEGRRALAHCTEGLDRTGLLVALWRVRRGASPADAYREWVAYGSHRFPLLEEAFERETGYRP